MKKRLFVTLMTLVLTISLAACGSSGGPSDSGGGSGGDSGGGAQSSQSSTDTPDGPIKIGMYGPLTGPNTMNGLAMQQGAELAISEINSSGGLLGRQMELIALDDKSNTEQAVKNVTRLCEVENVDMILASIHSTNILATADIVYKAKIPSLGTGTSPSWLAGEGKDYLFRVLPSNELTNAALINAIQTLGVTNVGIIYRADEAGNTNQESFSAICKDSGLNVVGVEAFQPNDTDVSGQLNKLIRAGMDGLVCYGTTADPIMVLNQLAKTGYTGKVFGPEIFSPYAIKEATGSASNGVIYAAPYALPKDADSASTEIEKEFLNRFVEHFGKMPESDVAYRTYDAVYLYKTAVENCQTTDGQQVTAALNEIDDFEGLGGTFQYKTAAAAGQRGEGILSCRLYVIEDGKDVLADSAKLEQIKSEWVK